MSGHLNLSRDEVRERVQKLRGRLGIFSFQNDVPSVNPVIPKGSLPELGVGSGSIVEFLVAREGGRGEYICLPDHVAICSWPWSLGNR